MRSKSLALFGVHARFCYRLKCTAAESSYLPPASTYRSSCAADGMAGWKQGFEDVYCVTILTQPRANAWEVCIVPIRRDALWLGGK